MVKEQRAFPIRSEGSCVCPFAVTRTTVLWVKTLEFPIPEKTKEEKTGVEPVFPFLNSISKVATRNDLRQQVLDFVDFEESPNHPRLITDSDRLCQGS